MHRSRRRFRDDDAQMRRDVDIRELRRPLKTIRQPRYRIIKPREPFFCPWNQPVTVGAVGKKEGDQIQEAVTVEEETKTSVRT